MDLQNSFSTSTEGEEESDVEENLSRNEKISPQVPRNIRMMERGKKRWHPKFNAECKKASVSVQLEEVTEVMELSAYLSSIEEDVGCEHLISTNPIASTSSKEVPGSPSPSKDKKFRRIKLFNSSSSSSETEDKTETEDKSSHKQKHKQRSENDDVEEIEIWTPFQYRFLDRQKSKSVSSKSSTKDNHHSYKGTTETHPHNKGPTSSQIKHEGGKHFSSVHRKKHPSLIDKSHHSRTSKERTSSTTSTTPHKYFFKI